MRTTTGKRTKFPRRYEPGFLRELDRRTEISQRLRAAYDEVMMDLGGIEQQSHIKRSLVERYVFLEAQLQAWEQKIATAPKEAAELLSRWVQALNSLQGLGRLLGIERRAQRAPSLSEYVKGGKHRKGA